jgi:hypothetical protein
MYAQKIEGNSWRGEKLDKGKIDKMSGKYFILNVRLYSYSLLDQQLGQLYELMQEIQSKGRKDEP